MTTNLNIVEVRDVTVESDVDGGYRVVAVDYDDVVYIYPKIYGENDYERAEDFAATTQQRGSINTNNWKEKELIV